MSDKWRHFSEATASAIRGTRTAAPGAAVRSAAYSSLVPGEKSTEQMFMRSARASCAGRVVKSTWNSEGINHVSGGRMMPVWLVMRP